MLAAIVIRLHDLHYVHVPTCEWRVISDWVARCLVIQLSPTKEIDQTPFSKILHLMKVDHPDKFDVQHCRKVELLEVVLAGESEFRSPRSAVRVHRCTVSPVKIVHPVITLAYSCFCTSDQRVLDIFLLTVEVMDFYWYCFSVTQRRNQYSKYSSSSDRKEMLRLDYLDVMIRFCLTTI